MFFIFHYTRCTTPKRVTGLRVHFRVIAPGQHSFFQRNIAAVASLWQHCVQFDLTGPRFEAQTSRSEDEYVTALPISRFK